MLLGCVGAVYESMWQVWIIFGSESEIDKVNISNVR